MRADMSVLTYHPGSLAASDRHVAADGSVRDPGLRGELRRWSAAAVFFSPAPVVVTFDDPLMRPVRRLVAPGPSFPDVARTDPAVGPLFGTLPAAVDPAPPASLPVPVAPDQDGVAVGPRRDSLVTGARRPCIGNADLEIRRRRLGQGRSRAEGHEQDRRDRYQDSSEHEDLPVLAKQGVCRFSPLERSTGCRGRG